MNIKNKVPEIPLFNMISTNEQRINDFYAFFYRYGLDPIFTDAYRTDHISVTDNDIGSVINEGGAYHKPLKELAQLLSMASDNDSYQEAMFRIIDEPKSFQTMMNYIKQFIEYIKHEIKET